MAVFTVSNTNDSGAGSLRQAILDANANADADTIGFQTGLAGGTIRLTSGALALTSDITIDGDTNGDDVADITISGDADSSGTATAGDSAIFSVTGSQSDVVLQSLALTQGHNLIAGGGAIVLGGDARLTIRDSSITNSTAASSFAGGGIVAYSGELIVLRSTISGNSAHGGGGISAWTNSTITVVNSAITDNHSTNYGGGLQLLSADATVINSTISGNDAIGYGGGISGSGNGTLQLLSSTVTDNTATTAGGGIDVFNGFALTATNSVVAGNGASDVSKTSGTITANNSFFGTAVSIDTGSNNTTSGGDPGLGALANNGGPVMTHAILAGSALIGAGNASLRPADPFDLDGDSNTTELLPLDSSGNARVVGSMDIGADEFGLEVTSSSDADSDGSSLAADRADGTGLTLREAIAWAAVGETITFASGLAGSTIRLQSQLELTQDIAIDGDTDGDGRADITISGDTDNNGSGDVRVFYVAGAGVTLASLTLTRGNSGEGGAIYSDGISSLTLLRSTVSYSAAAGLGGGISARGSFILADSTIHHNSATGDYGFGGGIYIAGLTTIINTTIAYNSASKDGGGIDTGSYAGLHLYTSTVTRNSATGNGGGLDLFNGAYAIVGSSIVSGNTAGTAANISKTGSSGSYLGAGYSLLGTDVPSLVTSNYANIYSDTPMLGVLRNNGGPVFTMAPLGVSLAIDNGIQPPDFFDQDNDGIGDPGELMPFDARGAVRLFGAHADIGAVEKQAANDAGAVTENSATSTASGNVLNNDATGSVFGFRAGAESTGAALNGLGTIAGIYGSLVLAANGNWTYTLNNADPDTNALAAGAVVTDKFTYGFYNGVTVDTAELAISITGANDAPDITSNGGGATAAISVAETSAAPTTAITTVTSTDPDAGGARFYGIYGGADQFRFGIDPTTGVLSFLSPDFETPTDVGGDNIYNVIVGVSDGSLPVTTQAFTVTVTDVDGNTITGNAKGNKISAAKAFAGKFATGEEDTIDGSGGNDTIFGAGGNDTLLGNTGDDTLNGETGNDKLRGGAGKDLFDGGAGLDTADYSDKTTGVVLTLNGKNQSIATVSGGAEDKVKNVENITGGRASDTLTGDKKANVLKGGAADDTLDGGKRSDTLEGGKGNDTLIGGLGNDTLKGGKGNDEFVFNAKLGATNVDLITDFKHDIDLIQLRGAIFPAIGPTLEAGEFFAKAGAVKAKQADDRIVYNLTTGDLYYDADGKGGAAAVRFATLTTKPMLDHGDFVIV